METNRNKKQLTIEIVMVPDFLPLPIWGSEEAAGMDILAIEDGHIPAGEQKMVPTGIHMSMPIGYYGSIESRSGLAKKYRIDSKGGIIDSDYRGEIIVLLENLGTDTFYYSKGDSICQMIIIKSTRPIFKRKKTVDELRPTKRNKNGFGSTGMPSQELSRV